MSYPENKECDWRFLRSRGRKLYYIAIILTSTQRVTVRFFLQSLSIRADGGSIAKENARSKVSKRRQRVVKNERER